MAEEEGGTGSLAGDAARRRKLEVELRRAREAAEAAVRSRNQFLSNVSHELRTPLNAILGYTGLLLEEARASGNERTRGDLEKVEGAARALLSIVEEVLDFSRVSSGRTERAVEAFDPVALMEEVAAVLQPMARRNNDRLEVRGLPGATMRSDRAKLGQVLQHLLSNAIKFTENGRIVLSLAFESKGEGERWALFRVVDTGIGITPAQLLSLFQPFAQGDASLTRKYGGTGLGLSLAKALSQSLGGDIAVESEAGMGTIFIVSVPADLP
jgi:signal transduction histidine kinase